MLKVAQKTKTVALSVMLILGLTSCSSTNTPSKDYQTETLKPTETRTPTAVQEKLNNVIDVTAIPIGDGKTLTIVPTEKGYLYVCNIVTGGGGAFSSPWAGESTWDSTKKVKVSGENFFPNASNTFTENNGSLTITTNGLPVGSATGNFPVASTDEAYHYDRNPNTITMQNIGITIPSNPQAATQPSCTNMGAIGYALNGVPIFNAVDAENRDAVAHEVQDICDGHPERSGTYHYHNSSTCLIEKAKNGEPTLIGYALDGFGIYVEKDINGNLKTNSDLDICHGLTSEVLWKGKKQKIYHYSATLEFPYTVGCFTGTPTKTFTENITPPQGPAGNIPPLKQLPPKP